MQVLLHGLRGGKRSVVVGGERRVRAALAHLQATKVRRVRGRHGVRQVGLRDVGGHDPRVRVLLREVLGRGG